MKTARGFSLPDVLVAIFLGSVLTYIIYLFFTGSLRHYFNSSEKLVLTEASQVLERTLSRELQRTTPDAITISQDKNNLTFQTFDGVVPPDRLGWSERIIIFKHEPENQNLHIWKATMRASGHTVNDFHQAQPLPQNLLATLTPPTSLEQDQQVLQNVSHFAASQINDGRILEVEATFSHHGIRQNRHFKQMKKLYRLDNDYEI